MSFTYKGADITADDRAPSGISCNSFSAFMQAYVWKFKHPFATVTDEDGNFEIKDCPVTTNGKLELWIWHEMLDVPENRVRVRVLELKDQGTEKVNFSIPR